MPEAAIAEVRQGISPCTEALSERTQWGSSARFQNFSPSIEISDRCHREARRPICNSRDRFSFSRMFAHFSLVHFSPILPKPRASRPPALIGL
jgi:hypothetical protein